ncbi:hypothetical protein ZHAS_00007791 [Anopheles sinensis]|uniref:Uncharacterized protein n=1 Tax=Anopheles sinensis TaxID=74873 RepID=A0A084VQR1_ANOSI|nr:hypothetical protein ZHAS_00007791 [Anopheles sinensis]
MLRTVMDHRYDRQPGNEGNAVGRRSSSPRPKVRPHRLGVRCNPKDKRLQFRESEVATRNRRIPTFHPLYGADGWIIDRSLNKRSNGVE